MFDARIPHGISAVEGKRLSVACFVPVRHDQVPKELQQALLSLGFPDGEPREVTEPSELRLPFLVADTAASSRQPTSEGERKGQPRQRKPRVHFADAAVLGAGACCAEGAQPKVRRPTRTRPYLPSTAKDAFQPDVDIGLSGLEHSDYRRFFRQLLNKSSRPLAASRLDTQPDHADILSMPLPFPPHATEIRVWPTSPRRLARIRRTHLRQRWVNHIVSYLSWLCIGKPGGMTADVRLVASALTPLQASCCDRLWHDMEALVCPCASFKHAGRGKLSDLLEALAADCSPYCDTLIGGTRPLCVKEDNMALPADAAVVDLVPPILLPELAKIFQDPKSLVLPEPEHPSRLPAMYMQVENWTGVARRLLDSGLVKTIPFASMPRSRGRSLASGLFGVSKPGSEKRRLIIDRRRKNACERSMREAACIAAVREQWADERLLEVIREMTLPHPLQLRDLFMVAESVLRIDTKDAKDYFYLMALPPGQLQATPVGWPLRGRELGMQDQADALLMLTMRAPAMGSKHSMEIAQATHHGVMRAAGVLEEGECENWMTLGWPPPKQPRWMGCYCDDLALISVCSAQDLTAPLKVNGVQSPHPDLLRENAARADAWERDAEAGYARAKFVVKREKCESNCTEGVVWGSELSSRRKDVGCPVEKIAGIAHATWQMIRARFVVTKHLEIIIGLWGHALLHC
eukprot:5231264-Amphidinium_carterae.1